MEDTKTTKTIDRLIENLNLRLAEYIDSQFYFPLKEELKGTTHSLGFKKELLKEKIESELEKLKKELEEMKKGLLKEKIEPELEKLKKDLDDMKKDLEEMKKEL